MRAFVKVTDIVKGIDVASQPHTLEPLSIPGFLRVEAPSGAQPGTEVYIVCKATIQAVIPG